MKTQCSPLRQQRYWLRPRLRLDWLCYLGLLCCFSLLSSCASYHVYKIQSPQLELDNEAYYYRDSVVEIAYDFWNPNGVPFVAVRNNTEKVLFLDLNQSNSLMRNRSTSLGAILIGGQAPVTQVSLKTVYPELPIERINNSLCIVIAPGTWVTFFSEGVGSNRVASSERRQYHNLYYFKLMDEFENVYSYEHSCSAELVKKVKRQEFMSSMGSLGHQPNHFFFDKTISRTEAAAIMMEGLSLIALIGSGI